VRNLVDELIDPEPWDLVVAQEKRYKEELEKLAKNY